MFPVSQEGPVLGKTWEAEREEQGNSCLLLNGSGEICVMFSVYGEVCACVNIECESL